MSIPGPAQLSSAPEPPPCPSPWGGVRAAPGEASSKAQGSQTPFDSASGASNCYSSHTL